MNSNKGLQIVHTVKELRAKVRRARQEGKTIGFLMTTGHLHDAHAHLATRLRTHSDFVVVSNLGQPSLTFSYTEYHNPNRSTAQDAEVLASSGVDILFAPSGLEIYPHGFANHTAVDVPGVSEGLCNVGERLGYFRGVATAILKMLNIVQPDVSLWGEKDYQQFAVVRKMVRDLHLPIEVISAPVVRHDNGLAYASRNAVLRPGERERAHHLYLAMAGVKADLEQGRELNASIEAAKDYLVEHGLTPDYIQVREAESLAQVTPASRNVIIFGAAYLGPDRLVDTLRVTLPEADVGDADGIRLG